MTSAGPSPSIASDPAVKARLFRQAAATKPLWFVARGTSMGRTIPTGSSVLVAQFTRPRRGQVWAYCDQAGGLVVHRYLRHTGAGHVLQGDTRIHPDAPVQDAQLIGRVTAVRRGDRVHSVGWSNWCLGECQRRSRVLIARARGIARRLRRGDG